MMTVNTVRGQEIQSNSSIQYMKQKAPVPNVQALCAIAMDLDSGKILYEKNGNQRNAPASTTKMMTAIVVCH